MIHFFNGMHWVEFHNSDNTDVNYVVMSFCLAVNFSCNNVKKQGMIPPVFKQLIKYQLLFVSPAIRILQFISQLLVPFISMLHGLKNGNLIYSKSYTPYGEEKD
jgi:hypothetical protein